VKTLKSSNVKANSKPTYSNHSDLKSLVSFDSVTASIAPFLVLRSHNTKTFLNLCDAKLKTGLAKKINLLGNTRLSTFLRNVRVMKST
jgi:hypothetical protein